MASRSFSGCQPRSTLDPVAGGHQLGRVAGAARLLDGGDLAAGHAAGGLDDLLDRVAVPGAEVVDRVPARLRALQRERVGAAEVLDVDVVAHGGAVARRVVGAEHLHVVAHAGGGPQHQRDQVRLGVVVLAEVPARARDVEVAQRGGGEPVGAALVADHAVDRQLGVAVGVDRRGGHVLAQRRRLGLDRRPRRWRRTPAGGRRPRASRRAGSARRRGCCGDSAPGAQPTPRPARARRSG